MIAVEAAYRAFYLKLSTIWLKTESATFDTTTFVVSGTAKELKGTAADTASDYKWISHDKDCINKDDGNHFTNWKSGLNTEEACRNGCD